MCVSPRSCAQSQAVTHLTTFLCEAFRVASTWSIVDAHEFVFREVILRLCGGAAPMTNRVLLDARSPTTNTPAINNHLPDLFFDSSALCMLALAAAAAGLCVRYSAARRLGREKTQECRPPVALALNSVVLVIRKLTF